MADLKEIVNGTQEKVLQETIDATTLYNITDLLNMMSATNTQMTNYLQGVYAKGQLVLCVDNGTYKQGTIYEFNGFGFVPKLKIAPVVTSITETNTNDQVVGAKAVYDKFVETNNSITAERTYVDTNKAPITSITITEV